MVLYLLSIIKYKKIDNIIVIEFNHEYNVIPDYYRMDSDKYILYSCLQQSNYSNEVSIFESITILCECFHMK
jgi:hypothetical protein